MRPFINRLLFFCLLICSYTSVKAIDEKYAAPALRGNQLAADSTSMVMDTVYFNPTLKPLQTTIFLKNLITFQIDESYRHLLPDEFDVSVTFVVHFTMDENGTPTTGVSDTITLSIGYSQYTKYGFKAAYISPDWWYKAEVEITSVDIPGSMNGFRDALVLTNEILINREYNFSCTDNAVQTISTDATTVASKGELKVYWSPQRAADEYDLEWTYVDSAARANYNVTGSTTVFDPKKIFPKNATRVSITKEDYLIPLLFEGAGSLFYRVRAVQVKSNGQRIESSWSSDYSGGLGKYDFRGHDTTLNWQASTSFAEEGKRKSVVQYFDGSLKSRQTVTKDNTTDTTIIAETFYDNQGRPVIQVMPSPSLSSIIKYTPSFNRLNGAEYSKDAYDGLLTDTCLCKKGVPTMDTAYGAAKYYSPHNHLAASGYHKYIPDARGFAFAETRYTPDNTGRISIQGGVADTFQIGHGHETNYTYNGADQEELDALFGTEVGNALHYFKNTVRDANGQVSISYVDMHGRTIATALAGKPPVKLDTLASNKSYTITKKLLDSTTNVVKGAVIESSKGLVVEKAGPHQFIYSLLPDSISIKDCDSTSVCYDCIYDLEITIADECNDSSKAVTTPITISRTNYQLSTACDSIAHFPAVDTTLYLNEGSYLVTKKLTINKQAMDYYRDSVFLIHNTCHTLEQAIEAQKQLLRQSMDCEPGCSGCRANIGDWATYRSNYMEQAGIPNSDTANYRVQAQLAFNNAVLECDKLCDSSGLHQNIREQMLADVTPPLGQYANPIQDSIDQFSIFWYSPDTYPQPNYKTAGAYKDENGNQDPLNPQTLSQDQFVAEFKTSWAETLLQVHPEYPKLQKFEQIAASNVWDIQFQNTETYSEAVTKGYLNPGDFTTHPTGSIFSYNSTYRDPFFTDLISNAVVADSFKTRMQDSLLTKAKDTSNNPISTWSMATIMAHCPGGDVSCLYHYKNIDSAFAIGSECSGDLDIAWQYFREMYLQEKRELIAQILNEAQQQNGGRFADLKELVDNHTPNFYDPNMMPPGSDINTSPSAGRDSLTKFINDNCAAYVQQWWEELKPCGYNSTDSAIIIPKLIQVCKEGGDSAHLFGASTVKPSSTYTYKSFEEVLKAYSDSTGKSYNAVCNVYLISAPRSYDQQPVYYDKPVFQKPDSCECATIGSLYQQYQFAGKDSSFSDYLYRTTGTRMYQGVLDTLRMTCNGQINCSFLKEPLSLPPVLQCGVKDVCITCIAVDTLMQNFKSEFPYAFPSFSETDSLQRTSNRLFENYMNNNTGFSKTAQEYLSFIDACNNNHPIICSDSLGYILDQFNTIYKNSSNYTPGGQYNCDTTDYSISAGFGISWAESIQNGVLTFPARITSNPGAIHYYYSKPLQIPANGLSIEARLKLPLLDTSNCSYPDFQFQLRPQGGFVNALFFQKSIPCSKTYGAFDLADSTHPGHIITNQNEMAIDMTDWVKIKMTILGNKYLIYVADTFLMEVPYTGTLSTLNSFGLYFNTGSTKTKAVPYVDYIKVYNGCNELVMDQEFNSVTDKVCPDLSVRVTPDDFKTAFTSYYNQYKNTNFNNAQIDSIYAGGCEGLKLNTCGYRSTRDTLTQWLKEYKKYGSIPHLDASGSDTTKWKVDFGGWNYTADVPLGEVIKNGVMSLPAYYADTITNKTSLGLDFVNDTLCLDSAGFTFETRMKLPDSVIISNIYGASAWLWLYTDSTAGTMLLATSPVNGQGVAVCTHHNDSKVACANENIPGQHFNDWRVVKFQFRGRDFKYFIDDSLVAQRTLDTPMTKLNHWSLQPYSMKAQIDYVRIYDTAGAMLYNENFNDAHNLAVYENRGKCSSCETRFVNYFNQRNGSNYNYVSIDSLYQNSEISVNPCTESPLLCGKTEPVFAPVILQQHSNCDDSTLFANSTGILLYEAYRDSLINSFNDRYLAKCLSARFHESFTLYQPINEFHYTLYYYDQAGNLLKTVPPVGVDVSKFGWGSAWSDSVKAARRSKQPLTPNHTLPTEYRYNSLNQVVAQQSPDGGLSEFWYDRLGRLVISRNARQKGASGTEENRLYSYTKYDSLGRITEVGQVSNTSANGAMTDDISRTEGSLENWLATLNNRRGQITNTVYDLPYPGFEGIGDTRLIIEQKNLRNRVSYTTFTDTGNVYNAGTFYTYDILGNVDWLLQDYGCSGYPATANVMNKNENRFKKIGYKYDLISGKVNMVMYQHGWMDGFFHRYSYDGENRLTLVETSKDSLVWEKEARYEYYRHGPLARVTLGEQQVQGIDYAYTLQGWLKGINSTGGTDSFDMGRDGNATSLNRYTAKDAIGLTLNYFGNDYTAINGTPFPGYSAYLPSGNYRPLYNGNISSSSVYQKKFDYDDSPGGPLIFYNYKYDQLNRLTGQDAYKGWYNTSTGLWDSLQSMGERLKERIAYDANGNILKYLRKSITGTDALMDSLNYFYYPNTNLLKRITDSIPADTYTSSQDNLILDIDGQPDSNYVYDAIGNLIIDSAEHITDIKWNVYGKIKEITKNDTVIKYSYDALGNRISQAVIPPSGDQVYTWYVRDAQGNIMSTYSAKGDESDLEDLTLKQSEKFLYGSSRLGLITVDDPDVDGGPGSMQYYYGTKWYERGAKQYELTNHLGNVLATISDRKFGIPSDTGSLIDHYEPHIVTAQDYYPFGMMSRVALPISGKTYKFGFNGKLNDDEVKGLGNQQDYGMRIYDPRIGKFLSVDPLTKDYPWYTPYQFAGNKPIWATDVDGEEESPTTNNDGSKPARESTSLNEYPTSSIVNNTTKRLYGGNNGNIWPGSGPNMWAKLKAQIEINKLPNSNFQGAAVVADMLYNIVNDVHITYTNIKNGRGLATDLTGEGGLGYKATIGAGLNTATLAFWGIHAAGERALINNSANMLIGQQGNLGEQVFGNNLNSISKGFPYFDNFNNGIATSAKTIDLTAESYLTNPRGITSQLNKYTNRIFDFPQKGVRRNGFSLRSEMIETKELGILTIGNANSAQRAALNAARVHAESLGIQFTLKNYRIPNGFTLRNAILAAPKTTTSN